MYQDVDTNNIPINTESYQQLESYKHSVHRISCVALSKILLSIVFLLKISFAMNLLIKVLFCIWTYTTR